MSFDRIEEVSGTPDETVIATASSEGVVFALDSGNISRIANPVVPYVRVTGNLTNGAIFDSLFELFYVPEIIDFANESIVLYSGSIKFTNTVKNWYGL